jgi:hypothetical protein
LTCLHRQCTSGSTSSSVCCGTGPNATVCKNLGTDPANCGYCGGSCESGTCVATTEDNHYSGVCSCSGGGSQCPMPASQQQCATGKCTCNDDNNRCGAGSTCGNDLCYYP